MAKNGLYLALVILLILHLDLWNWNNADLVFGLLPVGLVYHIGFCVAAILLMAGLVNFAWPFDDQEDNP